MASTIKVDEILDSQGNQFDGSQLGNVGKVLNVYTTSVSGSGNISTSSTTHVGIGLSLTVTPTTANSKFLIFFSTVSHINVYTPNYGGSGIIYANGVATDIRLIDYKYKYSTVGLWGTKTIGSEGIYQASSINPITFDAKFAMDYASSGGGNFYYIFHETNASVGTRPYMRIIEIGE